MKQIKFLAVAVMIVIAGAFSANAQKLGSVDVDAIVYSLPEIQKVQQDLEKFQRDSIGSEFERLSSEINRKDSIVKNSSTPKSVKETAEKDLNDLRLSAANWQNYAQQWNQAKQGQLLAPLYDKVEKAIETYAKEKGYTYILTRAAFVVIPEADNISIPVAQKLGIKVDAKGNITPPAAAPTGVK